MKVCKRITPDSLKYVLPMIPSNAIAITVIYYRIKRKYCENAIKLKRRPRYSKKRIMTLPSRFSSF